jgi:hypothetical protein
MGPSAVGTLYSVTIHHLGSADPDRVRKIVRSYLDRDVTVEELAEVPYTVADGISYALAEPLRAILGKARTSVEMLKK